MQQLATDPQNLVLADPILFIAYLNTTPARFTSREWHRMSDKASEISLLDELEARQNQVLDELDELNTQIEALLDEYLDKRDAERSRAAA